MRRRDGLRPASPPFEGEPPAADQSWPPVTSSRDPQSLRPKPHKRPGSASSMRFWSKLVAMPRWIVSRLSVCGGLKMFRSSRSGGPTVSLTP